MTGTAKNRGAPGEDTAGVIAPPILIYVVAVAVGLALQILWPLELFGSPRWLVAALLSLGAGVTLMGLAIREFTRAGTEYVPNRPARCLVTGGPFRLTRNPLYLSLTLIHIAVALALDSLWVMLTLIPALAVIRFGVIAREERYLERRFGQAYRDYKASVHRWI